MPAKPRLSSPEDDLAFMRSIVDGGGSGSVPMTLAICYLAGGLLYGIQCLYHLAQALEIISPPDLVNLAVVVGITGTFLAILTWAILHDRKAGPANRGPLATRVTSAAFSATGMVNAAMVIVFGMGAARDGDFAIWLYYAAMVFALQAAAWYVAWVLKKRAWMLATSIGGWCAAVALGLLVREPLAYLWVCTVSLFLLFALPGWALYRDARARTA